MSTDRPIGQPDLADWSSAVKRALQPFQLLMIVYVAYLAVAYSQVWRYVPAELLSLRTYIMGWHPSLQTLGLYVFGAVVLTLGYLCGVWLTARVRGDGPLAEGVWALRRRASARLYNTDAWFVVAVAGWGVGAAAIAVQWYMSRGISLTDIGTRWYQSPIIVWVAMSQIFFLPMLVATARRPWQRWVTVALFAVGVVGLATLGARNIPAKAVVATFVALVYVARPRNLARIGVVLLLVLVLAMGTVGAFSKSGIYGTAASAKLAVALSYSDSVGTAYNLDRIVRLTPSLGLYGGTLLRDSLMAGVPRALYPGEKPDYANYQIGRYLGGRQQFVIGGETIERGVSLAPTLLGAAYADTGVPGVALQMWLLGVLFGYLQLRARRALWIVPFLSLFASYVVNGVNVGLYSPHALAAVASTVLVMTVDLLTARRADAAPTSGE